MLYIIELESLKERYTEWWSHYIPEEIRKIGVDFEIISGTSLSDTVETGTVLDAGSTNYFKASQLQKISELFYNKKIKPYDIFFVADIWFPGIEMIRYMSQLYQIPVKIYGVWHAGSTTHGDFAEPMHNWSKNFEIGFLNICDGIFVGSDYSKKAIIERLLYSVSEEEAESIFNRIHAYGMPIDYEYLQQFSSDKKENIILFPHRPDIEKNPHIWINIIQGLSTFWEDFEKYEFVFCTSKAKYQSQSSWINALLGSVKTKIENIEIYENLAKEKYYQLLGKSRLMISTTSEENFGYCAVEALALGTQILVPNAFSHPEIVEDKDSLLYDSYDDLMKKVSKISTEKIESLVYKELVKPYSEVIRKWLEIMVK